MAIKANIVMRRIITLILCVLLVGQLALTGVSAKESAKTAFDDVKAGSWYYEAVNYVFMHGVMKGTGNRTFSPNVATTRAEVVTILWRLSGAPDVVNLSSFGDVSNDAWYYKSVNWAANMGITDGTGTNTFSPTRKVTREEIVVFLYRYAKFRGLDINHLADISSYTDSKSVSNFAKEAMRWAVKAGIVSGVSKYELAPKANATRAQVATMLYRVMTSLGVQEYTKTQRVGAGLEETLYSNFGTKLGNKGIFVENLVTGASIEVNFGIDFSSHKTVSASLIKLWVMGAIYEKIEVGSIKESDVKSDLKLMIQNSNNEACNRLVKKLGNGSRNKGIAAVNAFIKEYNFPCTVMNRLMLENNGTQNYTSVRDCARFMRLLYRGDLVSKNSSASMLEIMKGSDRQYLGAGVPSNVVIAHKWGSLINLCWGWAGIVFANEPYIICVIDEGSADGANLVKNVSRVVYDYLK